MNVNLNNVVGCLCEIKTIDNELLTLGRISAYIPEDKSIEIVPCEGNDMPNAQYSTKVKVNVFSSTFGYVGLYGFVYIAYSGFWRLYDVNCFSENERRSFFRITVRSKAEAEEIIKHDQTLDSQQDAVDNPVAKYPCIVTSISISGLLFAVDDDACNYQIGSTLMIKGFTVGESGHVFSLKCRVKRTDCHEKHGKLFGCEFLDFDDKVTERLCRDIFEQQRIEIQRGRGILPRPSTIEYY